MPNIPIDTGGGGGGIPTKYLVIGGGAAVLAFFLISRKGSAPASTGNDPVYGAALGPNAALALGDLQTRLMQESGRLQGQLSDTLNGLSSRIDVAASTLGDQGTQQQKHLFDFLNAISANDQDYATRLYMNLLGQGQLNSLQLQNDISQLNAGGAGLPAPFFTVGNPGAAPATS